MEEKTVVATEAPEKFMETLTDEEKKLALLKKLEVLKSNLDILEERYLKNAEVEAATATKEVSESAPYYYYFETSEFKAKLQTLQIISSDVRANLSVMGQFSHLEKREFDQSIDLLEVIQEKYREILEKISFKSVS